MSLHNPIAQKDESRSEIPFAPLCHMRVSEQTRDLL